MWSVGDIIAMSAAVVLTSYIVTSVLFFKYPTILHKKKLLKFKCTHISHRGGAGENLENTLAAFKHAVNVGTDMLELDVHLTKDEQVVVSHDHNLFRATGVNVDISAVNYSELPILKKTLPIDFDRGCVFEAHSDADRRIPLLKQVFETFPKLPINIDIKTDNDLLIHKVSELIKDYCREEFTVWGNFSDRVTRKCYKENPNIPLLFSLRSVLLLVLKLYSGVLPFVPLKESCLETIMPSIINKRDSEKPDLSTTVRLLAWLTDKLLMRKFLFNHLDKRGIQTYLWVLNKEEDYDKAFRMGATGVMTDYPNKLQAFLEKNPQYKNRSN